MKVRALRREKIMGGRAEVLTPAEAEVNIYYVIRNGISSCDYVEYGRASESSMDEREIELGRISYRDGGKKKTIKKGAIVFEEISDFIEFLSTIYIPEGKYIIDEFISDIQRRSKNQKGKGKEIQDELINVLFQSDSSRDITFGPFYVEAEKYIDEVRINMIGSREFVSLGIELAALSMFPNFFFRRGKEILIALKKNFLDVKGKQVPYSKFLAKSSGDFALIWDSNALKFADVSRYSEVKDPYLDEDIEDINSGGETYYSWFFEYLPLPQAEVKFIVRIPSVDEVRKLKIDLEKIVWRTPPVKDTVYMVDALSALTPKQLSSAKSVIDDPEDALKIWARIFSNIFVPEDMPSSSVPLPERELYLAGVVI